MRAFLILCSVVSAAYAASLGYNYGSPVPVLGGQAIAGPSYGGQALAGPSYGGQALAGPSYSGQALAGPNFGGQALAGPSYGGQALAGPSFGGQALAGPSYGGQALAGPSYGGQALAGPSYGGQALAGPSYSAPAPVPELNKEFFSYTAPEHEFNDAGDAGDIANALKKNVRVIFVKGPQNSALENAAVQLLAKNAVEEHTAIYVLNKQADIGDLANKLNSVDHRNAYKPEVHFVKYRTPADAENAKQAIQSQYDDLGGNTSSFSGGVAPVLDFASKPVAPVAQQPISSADGAYLPPTKV